MSITSISWDSPIFTTRFISYYKIIIFLEIILPRNNPIQKFRFECGFGNDLCSSCQGHALKKWQVATFHSKFHHQVATWHFYRACPWQDAQRAFSNPFPSDFKFKKCPWIILPWKFLKIHNIFLFKNKFNFSKY